MALTETITADIKNAMLAKDKERLAVLRAIKSALLLEATSGADAISEAVEIQILQKLQKQRNEAATIYKEQDRSEQYEEEMFQANVIAEYLPKPLSNEQLEAALKNIIAKIGAVSAADMGKVMGAASKELAGKIDGKTLSAKVKELLV
jgi:uncharacterized protein YqeY